MTSGDRLSSLQNLGKWVALLTMALDHVGSVLFPEALFLRFVGRLAWPLFAVLVAVNLGARGVTARRYLSRLWLWAVPAQLAFLALGWGELNVLVTLALGVTVWGVLRGELSPWWALTLLVAPWVQYGPLGVLLVPLVAAAVMLRRWQPAALAGVALLLSQGSLFWASATAVAVACAVGVMAIAAAVGRQLGHRGEVAWLRVPRPPRSWAYGFYPVHLLTLAAVRAVAAAVPA